MYFYFLFVKYFNMLRINKNPTTHQPIPAINNMDG